MRTFIFVLLIVAAGACGQQKNVQNNSKAGEVENAVRDKKFTFVARTVLPAGGRVVQLTSTYDLRITPDSVIAFLPYFGRAYTAPIGRRDGGVQFTSTDFEYKVNSRKKGSWQVEIRPRDVNDIQQMFVNVSKSGMASVQVTSNNRQAITYNGRVEPRAN